MKTKRKEKLIIGGKLQTTYNALRATQTVSGGTLTLAKLAKLYNDILVLEGDKHDKPLKVDKDI